MDAIARIFEFGFIRCISFYDVFMGFLLLYVINSFVVLKLSIDT